MGEYFEVISLLFFNIFFDRVVRQVNERAIRGRECNREMRMERDGKLNKYYM